MENCLTGWFRTSMIRAGRVGRPKRGRRARNTRPAKSAEDLDAEMEVWRSVLPVRGETLISFTIGLYFVCKSSRCCRDGMKDAR